MGLEHSGALLLLYGVLRLTYMAIYGRMPINTWVLLIETQNSLHFISILYRL